MLPVCLSFYSLTKSIFMKVPTLYLRANIYGIVKGIKTYVTNDTVTGVYEMQQHLLKFYGIKTSTTTIWKAIKEHKPTLFKRFDKKEDYLGYCNWVLNCSNKETKFYSDVVDKTKWTQDNPVKDVVIIIEKVKF